MNTQSLMRHISPYINPLFTFSFSRIFRKTKSINIGRQSPRVHLMRHVYFKLSWEPYQVNRDEHAENGDCFPKFDKLKVKNEH